MVLFFILNFSFTRKKIRGRGEREYENNGELITLDDLRRKKPQSDL